MTKPASNPKSRTEVIEQLATDALEAIEESDIIDLTAAEVLSAVYTLTKRVTRIMVTAEDQRDASHNIDLVTTAIGELYALVPEGTIH